MVWFGHEKSEAGQICPLFPIQILVNLVHIAYMQLIHMCVFLDKELVLISLLFFVPPG